ncbi:unnamed protein product, partial [Mesorhabditis spiculigera]
MGLPHHLSPVHPGSSRQFILIAAYCIGFIYLFSLFFRSATDRTNFFEKNHECVFDKTGELDAIELWRRLPQVVNQCSVRSRLNIQGFVNTDETKYHVMPTGYAYAPGHECAVISLGIGKDVEAERQMLTALPHCDFFGADPVNDTNADLYPEVGRFFNIAVGASNGTMKAEILEDHYKFREVPYIDIATFVRSYVKRRVVDQMMIDIEHAEYPMLDYLLKDGQLARDGVVVCQINIEIHNPSTEEKEIFHRFYTKMMAERQYTMLTASTVIGHIRMFMINDQDEECHQRYVGDAYERESSTAEKKE